MTRGLVWSALALALGAPLLLATQSPLLQWRDPIYILGGFAGIFGLALMLLQPLLIARLIPGLNHRRTRALHRIAGTLLVLAVLTHIAGLWITSPPDVVDVLLFRSPTPFGVWGALAMWGVFCAALLAVFRRRVSLRVWRRGHTLATALAVAGTLPHALLIEGAMEPWSKAVLCGAVFLATVHAYRTLRSFR